MIYNEYINIKGETLMKIKESRVLSFVSVFIIYLLASFVGIIVFHFLGLPDWIRLLIADVSATVFVFIFSLIFKNASVYDPYWSVQPIVIVFAIGLKYGFNLCSFLLFLVICIWGVRLTSNWAYTFKGLNYQDWRYTMLKEKTGSFYPIVNFLGIHLVPTLIVYACTLPAVYVIKHAPHLDTWKIVFLIFSLLAVLLQTVSDIQMHVYRKNKNGTFMRNGLWKYSRHPNYLGEICMWWGVALYGVVLIPSMWYLIAGAVANTIMFLIISIPMQDARQSKKDGFSEYKKQTHMLLPIKKLFIK